MGALLRLCVVLAAAMTAVLPATPALAHKCGQYPTFIEPILCRL